MRSDIGLHDLKHLRKGIVERMMCVVGRSGLRMVSLSPCFRSGVGWSEFIILFPCGLLVDNNTLSKMCVFKSYWLC